MNARATRHWTLLALLAAAAGCRGTLPPKNAEPSVGLSAVLVRGRILLPTGETRAGKFFLNLESDAEKYRVHFTPEVTTLYVVEPGAYHLYPTRDFFGASQYNFTASINGKSYRIPFPRDILRRDPLIIKPKHIYSVGVLEVRLAPIPGRAEYAMSVSLDDRVETRRRLVQDMIRRMMDPNSPPSLRDSAVAWTQALDQALAQLLGTKDVRPAFKPPE